MQGAEVQHSRMGEKERKRVGWGLGERIRELEVLLASEKESERASEHEKRRVKIVKKKERDSLHGAQESPTLRKGERQRKKYGEIESEEK